MQVAALGFVDSMITPKGNGQPKQSNGFAECLSDHMQMKHVDDENQPIKEGDEKLSQKELAELSQWMKSTDISEIDKGTELFQQMISNMDIDMADLIKSHLQMTDEDLLSSIYSFLKDLNLAPLGEGVSKKDISSLLDELPQMNGQEGLQSFVDIIPLLNMEQIPFKFNQDLTDLSKSLKLFQLLSSYEKKGTEQHALKDFLQKIEVSLAGLLKEGGLTNRKEYLQQLFAPVSKEVNQHALSIRQSQSVLFSQALIAEEGPNDNLSIRQNNIQFDSNGGGLFQFQQMSKTEQLILMMDKSGQSVSTEQLIQQFEKILSNGQFNKTGNTQRLFIKLNPDHLGMLKIELVQKDSSIMAKIVTTNGTAKELLESQLQSLKTAFGLQNIQLDKIEISQQMNQQERFSNKDSQQHKQQEQPENEEQMQQEQSKEFSISFEEALISTEV